LGCVPGDLPAEGAKRLQQRPPSMRVRRGGHLKRDGQGSTPEIEALHRASAHCHAAFAYCATEASEVHLLEDLLCLADCAQICSVAAGFIARSSTYANTLRGVCIQMCEDACATCAEYPRDEVLSACADVLRDACDALGAAIVRAD
jgi:hypothetical protein